MNRFTKFIREYFYIITLTLLIILLVRTCSIDIKGLNKRVDSLSRKIDTLSVTTINKKDLVIEGLKTEKRLIQSTDRKILDVNRQSEIDKELATLAN